jgi:hypothetical protein
MKKRKREKNGRDSHSNFHSFPGRCRTRKLATSDTFSHIHNFAGKIFSKKKIKKEESNATDTSTLSSSSSLRLTFFSQTHESVIICKLASSGTLAGEIDSSHSEISTGKSSGVCRL